jgi:queuine/archaeosine tRNA-ribosyltransferase
MTHPADRRHRFLIGKHKGERRARGYWDKAYFKTESERNQFFIRQARLRRDTTKLCSCIFCQNYSEKKANLYKRRTRWELT